MTLQENISHYEKLVEYDSRLLQQRAFSPLFSIYKARQKENEQTLAWLKELRTKRRQVRALRELVRRHEEAETK
jgi:hypothetical protein